MLSLTSPVETRFHRWPAGVKLGGLALVSAALFFVPHPAPLALALAAVAALYLSQGVVFAREGVARMRPLLPFVVLVLAWHLVAGDLGVGLGMVLRITAIVGLANLVTMTTRLDAMIALVLRLLGPFARLSLPVGAIGLAIAMVIRFTPRMIALWAQMTTSWRARAVRRPGWRLAIPVTLAALDDADQIALALRARGGIPREGPHGT